MGKTITLTLVVGMLLLVGLSMAATSQVAKADDGPLVTLDLRDVTIRDALAALFKFKPEAGYSIISGDNAMIRSMKLTEVPFDSALKAMMKSAGLTYRMDNGAYFISAREAQPPAVASYIPPVSDFAPVAAMTGVSAAVSDEKVVTEKITLNYLDPYDVASLLNAQPNFRATAIGMSPGMGASMGISYPGYGMGNMGYGMSSPYTTGNQNYGMGGYNSSPQMDPWRQNRSMRTGGSMAPVMAR